ncbi:hypothetical protein Pmani_004142 [Petrolisthes manimaculis]|uniref:Sushi domain-containing protein n=1 Tax=Petrolisthes manimaculis TaxID=1843537 RepID=A0AAE1ULU4_9EUCA|nr:hypothetical protein Pmani_004142 [Petrolisthes manimaculis]
MDSVYRVMTSPPVHTVTNLDGPTRHQQRREADKEGCRAPTEVPGGHYKCHTPVATPANIPIPKDDPQATRDTRHTNINMVNSISYPEGTVCKLECEKGWTVLVSQRGRHQLTCTPGAHWDHRPPLCYRKVAPALSRGECEDLTIARSHSLLSYMPLPMFTTASGVAARVTCLLEVESGGRNIRTCTAQDPELETTSTCTYTITVPDEYRDPDVIFLSDPSVGVGVKPYYNQPTTAQPYQPTTAQPFHPTTAQSFHPTTAQPYHPTTAQSFHPTTAQSNHPTTAQSFHPTTAQPYNPTTAQPYHPTTAQPYPNLTKHQTTSTQNRDLPLHELDNEYVDEAGYNYDVFDGDYGGGDIDIYEEFGL